MSSVFSALHPSLQRAVKDLGFTEATPIQKEAIPVALEGRDLMACAMTGSGKTAAFVLPILNELLEMQRGATRVLVVTPTRELAAQVEEHLRLLGRHTPITSATIFGGVAMGPQQSAFRKRVDVLVATPGRLLDHLSRPYADLDDVEFLVLDEADRMLDMGFLPDIRRILKQVPEDRQTMLFSATMPQPIQELARDFMVDPVAVGTERKSAPAVGITHAVYPVAQTQKPVLLEQLLGSGEMESVVVFTRTKHRANRVADYLSKRGISCARIHGNRSQSQRTLALSGFRKGEFRVLVATDIAARGIDIEALSHVVNFDLPAVPEDYIHRVGRTARAEATGDAISFVSPEEESNLKDIERALGMKLPRAQTPALSATEPPTTAAAAPARPARPARPGEASRPSTRPSRGRVTSELAPAQAPRERQEPRPVLAQTPRERVAPRPAAAKAPREGAAPRAVTARSAEERSKPRSAPAQRAPRGSRGGTAQPPAAQAAAPTSGRAAAPRPGKAAGKISTPSSRRPVTVGSTQWAPPPHGVGTSYRAAQQSGQRPDQPRHAGR